MTGSRRSSLSVKVAGLGGGLAVADVTRQTNFRARRGQERSPASRPACVIVIVITRLLILHVRPREIINPTIGKRGKGLQSRNHNSQPFASFTIIVYRSFSKEVTVPIDESGSGAT